MTLNRSNTVKSRSKESGRKCGERLRIAGRLEPPNGPGCPRKFWVGAQQIELGEHPQQVLGCLLCARHQRDLVSHRQLDQSGQHRVVGTPQHQSVDPGALQRLQIALGQPQHLPAAGDAALNEVDEPGQATPVISASRAAANAS